MNNTTENMKNKSHEIYEKLKTERDQLKLKRYLMNEELEEKWQSSEKQWSRLKSKFSTITKGAGEAVDDLSLGFSVLGDEIKEAYKDIKLGIKSSKLTK